MTERFTNPEDALHALRSAVVPVESPEAAAALRDRTVANLRSLQARAHVHRQMAGSFRKRLLVAALVLLPSGALAGTWVVLRTPVFAAKSTPTPVDPVAVRARARHHSLAPHTEQTAPSVAETAPVVKPVPRRTAVTRPESVEAPSSTLAKENALLEAAMTAERAGDDARAVALLDELIGRFPRSPLASSSASERRRAAARLAAASDPAPR